MYRQLWKKLWKGWCLGSLGLTFSLAVSSATAADVQWRAASDAKSDPPPAANAPAHPITWTKASSTTASPAPATSILAPVPLGAKPDPLQMASFSGSTDSPLPSIIRGQHADTPKAMPVGLPEVPDDPAPLKKTSQQLLMPSPLPAPSGACVSCQPCPCPCCDSCCTCNPDGHAAFWGHDAGPASPCFWIGADALVWWIKPNRVPALVTIGSPADAIPGALGQPGTRVLFGGSDTDVEPRAGVRVNMGYWFTDDHCIGIDASGFVLSSRSVNFVAGSNGSPVLARPFFDVAPMAGGPLTGPGQNSELVALSPVLAGAIGVNLKTDLWGFDTNLRTNLWNGCWYKVDLLGGFRFLALDEDLRISEQLAVAGAPDFGVPPVNIALGDRFRTQNRFYGAQVGFDTELFWGRWSLDLLTKLAIGEVHETINISGATIFSTGSVIAPVQPGGLLALPTNMGNYNRNRFAVMPEIGVKVGYDVFDWLRLSVGYNFLLVSNVARPGQQIDPRVNTTQQPIFNPVSGQAVAGTLVGPPFPQFTGRDSAFWVQGITFGVEFRW